MALTYKKVMETDYGKLTTAAKAWDDMAAEFKKAESAYAAAVRGVKVDSGWHGIAAGRAYVNFAGTQYEYSAAQTQAKAIADLLRDAHGQFTELKKALETLVADARKDKMKVDADGNVQPDLTASERQAYVHDPDGQKLLGDYARAARSWADQIQKYVKAFEDADAGMKMALEGAVKDSNKDLLTGKDDTANGFNAGAKGDIEKYELEYAKDVTTRLNKGEPVSEAEVQGLNRILRDNNNEAFQHRTNFGQTYLTSVGAEGALKLTNRLSDLAHFDDKDSKKSYLDVQKNLANTMAAATHVPPMKRDGKVLALGSREYAEEFAKWRKTSDADFYNSWLADIKKNGTEEFDSKVTNLNRSSGMDQKALGYQSLVTLMQQGSDKYSAPFLHDLADSIRAAEDPTQEGGKKDIWDLSHSFDSGKTSGPGWFANDPLDGLLGVMSKNPDAATAYFDPEAYSYSQKDDEGKVDKFGSERLEYLQTKRDWNVVDEYRTTQKDGVSVYRGDIEDGDNRVGFGAALEAASTGNVPGTPASENFTKHTPAQTRVLESLITSYAEIAKIDQTAMPANIRVNMANALAYYPEDVHQILADQVNYAGRDSTEPNGVDVSTEDMRKFIRAASEDGGAFRMIHDSQMGLITEQISSLDRQDLTQKPTGNNDHAMGVVVDAGKIMGTLDEVRADALVDERDRQTSENNWNKTYKYHLYGAPVTGLPVFGDSIQRSIDILTGKQAEELNNAVADKTKEQLIEHYNKHGYPRLRELLNDHADTFMMTKDEKTLSGGRLGTLRTAAGNSYSSGLGLTRGSAGE
ncbi:hypothetical protein AB0H29_23095 [Streptomyces thermolilacinus]